MVDVFSLPLEHIAASANVPIHGGEVDTSLMLFLEPSLVELERAQDVSTNPKMARRYVRGGANALPKDSPGSIGSPTLASAQQGQEIYRAIFDRVAARVFTPAGTGNAS